MRHHHAPIRDFRRALRQHRSNILIGETVESVTTNPLVVQLSCERECLGYLGQAAMKGRVETGYLQQLGIKCARSSDRGEIMRLVQWRQRDQGLQLDQQFLSYTFWPDT